MEFRDKTVSLKTGEKLVIKQATVKDAMTIYKIQNSGFGEKPWSYLNYVIDLMRPLRCYFLAYLNGKPVSMLGSRYVKKTNSWHGRNFATLDKYQGKGIGRVLFDTQLNYFAENGAREYRFETKVTNPAKHLYERMGFEQIDILKHYYKDGTDAREYWMDLKLRNLVNGNVPTSISTDDRCFTENGDFEQELDTFLTKVQKHGKRVVTFDSVSGNGSVYDEWAGVIIYRKPFAAVCEKYPKVKELLTKEQLEWLTSDGNNGIRIETDQLRKIKQAMKLAKSGGVNIMVKFSDGNELIDGLTVAQTIESKAICYFNRHKWDLYCADPFHNTSSLLFSILLLDRIYLRIASQALGDNDVVMSLDEIEKMFDESVTALKCSSIDYLRLKTKQLMRRVDGDDKTRLLLTKNYYQMHNDHKNLETIYYFLEAEISTFKENLAVVDDNDVRHVVNSLFRAMHNYKHHLNDDFKYVLDKKIDMIVASKLQLNDISRAKNQERVLRFLVLYYLVKDGKSTYGQVDINNSIEIANEKLVQLLTDDDFAQKVISIFYKVRDMSLPVLLKYEDYELETTYSKNMLLLAHHKLLLSAMYLDKMHLDQSIKSLANQIK